MLLLMSVVSTVPGTVAGRKPWSGKCRLDTFSPFRPTESYLMHFQPEFNS